MKKFKAVRRLPRLNRAARLSCDMKQQNQIALWSLRVLYDLKGWKQMKSGRRNDFTSNCDILEAIGLERFEDKEMEQKEFLETLRQQIITIENKPLASNKHLADNSKKIADYIGLNETERQILVFVILLETNQKLQEITDTLGDISADGVILALSTILDLPASEVRDALSPHRVSAKASILDIRRGQYGRLRRQVERKNILPISGMVILSRNNMNEMRHKLDVLEGLAEALHEPGATIETLLQHYFTLSGQPELIEEDYHHVAERITLIQEHLKEARRQQMQGVNILVYGLPGTGKTELAKTISKALGSILYEVNIGDDDRPFSKTKRIRAFQLAQQVLARQNNAVLLFDEVDSLLEEHFSFFGRDGDSLNLKAWINRNLENNPVPAIWIANDIQSSESAFIRRFDIVLNLATPPRSTRLKILTNSLQGVPVRQQWLELLAENKHISPAVITRAASVIRCQKHQPSEKIEKNLEQLLESTLTAMGYPRVPVINRQSQLNYHLDAVNPDHNLKGVIQGLQSQGEGRLCLYGPPGTGKTEFGHYLARQLDKPLLIKRSSDLLGPYVGETEANIAKMFQEASYEEAVLLLDEADSFLRDRSEARRSWEVTQVNELLTQMERFNGIFICSTNLMDSLDTASLRRFDLKIKFDFLKPKQSWQLFSSLLTEQGVTFTRKEHWQRELAKYSSLTPGDFATVVRKSRISSVHLSPESLLGDLAKEAIFKRSGSERRIGFLAASNAI